MSAWKAGHANWKLQGCHLVLKISPSHMGILVCAGRRGDEVLWKGLSQTCINILPLEAGVSNYLTNIEGYLRQCSSRYVLPVPVQQDQLVH